MILVIVKAAEPARVAEGLRAGLGLGLRGDPVEVVLSGPAAAVDPSHPRIARALGTLAQLGRPVRVVTDQELAELRARAAAIEVWGPAVPSNRTVELRGAAASQHLSLDQVDNDDLVRHILADDVVGLD